MNEKTKYESPMMEVIDAKVEKGFAGSSASPDDSPKGTEGLTNGASYDFD